MATIKVDHVGLNFTVLDVARASIKHQFRRVLGGEVETSRGHTVVHALKDINFSARAGDRIALLGQNGSGKSSLLRVLGGIYAPTLGKVSTTGRVSCLFDMWFGMDLDATGRENVTLRGMCLGLTKRAAEAMLPDVLELTELGPYIDLPVRTYSLGMQTRLAFAVTTAVRGDILLLDEVIGSADWNFVGAARGRLEQMIGDAGIAVITSHDMSLVRRLCNRGLLLANGHLAMDGAVADVVAAYESGSGYTSAG